MIINVTQQHIDEGIQACANQCPVALALREATNLNTTIFSQIFLWEGDDTRNYLYQASTPQHVLDRIRNYDMNDLMAPFDFEIDYER